ncbi:unnamed protein product, partial [Vitis vinifera]
MVVVEIGLGGGKLKESRATPMEAQASTLASTPAPTPAPLVVNVEYYKEIERAHRYLCAFISNKKCAPMMLLFHDAGTYDALTKTGGPNGSIRNPQELNHSANRGLKTAVDLCEEVKRRHHCITYADLYQLAGVVVVEIIGGPTIYALWPCLWKRSAEHLRSVFNRMGLEDKDIVALSGAHTLGGARKQVPGFDGKWTEEPWKFDNSYFKRGFNREAGDCLYFPQTKH